MIDDEGYVIVIDNGSAFCKIGFAGDASPRAVFPSVVGKLKLKQDKFETEEFVGSEAIKNRHTLKLTFPVLQGIITHWDEMEKIWHHAFYNELRVKPEEHPVLIAIALLTPKANIRRITQIMFESFEVDGLFFSCQTILSLYATGCVTGLLLDVGAGISHVIPCYEAYALPHAIIRINVAGNDLTEYLTKLLLEKGSSSDGYDRELMEDIKKRFCYVAQDYEEELVNFNEGNVKEKEYVLSNGNFIKIGEERFKCPEVLFKPSVLGRDDEGIHHSVFSSIMKSDEEIRIDLFENILLSGGSTMFKGIEVRLRKEIAALAPVGTIIKVIASPTRERDSWIGGSILASLPTFPQHLIGKGEYEESGPACVDKINVF